MDNSFGVDTEYLLREFDRLKSTIDNRPGDEIARYLRRLADVADPIRMTNPAPTPPELPDNSLDLEAATWPGKDEGPNADGLVHTMISLLSTDEAMGNALPPTYAGWLAMARSLRSALPQAQAPNLETANEMLLKYYHAHCFIDYDANTPEEAEKARPRLAKAKYALIAAITQTASPKEGDGLREALFFYADENNWYESPGAWGIQPYSKIEKDCGAIARAALSPSPSQAQAAPVSGLREVLERIQRIAMTARPADLSYMPGSAMAWENAVKAEYIQVATPEDRKDGEE